MKQDSDTTSQAPAAIRSGRPPAKNPPQRSIPAFSQTLPDGTLRVTPIGVFHSTARHPYDVPRQGVLPGGSTGVIELKDGCRFEQALENLEGFSHLWILFWFDRNGTWRPKIQPPRHRDGKVGVFASRSPYRPNPIGISAVRLEKAEGLRLTISGADLLDGTPILDIKPYLAYADAFVDAAPGWTAQGDPRVYAVVLSEAAKQQLDWLEAHGVAALRGFILDHLAMEPENPKRHRLMRRDGALLLAYRTWRVMFRVDFDCVEVIAILSGYTEDERTDASSDPYGDKPLHRAFVAKFGAETI